MAAAAEKQNITGKASDAARTGAFPLFIRLVKMPGLMAGLLVLLAAGYGYAMAVPAVNMDDLALDVYYQGGEFLRQGRFTVWLLQKFTGIMAYQRFWPELFAALCLLLAGLVLAAVLYRVSGRTPRALPALLLAGGLLVWPYHAELLVYANQCGMGLGFLLCAGALALARVHILEGRGQAGACGAACLLALALGCYESFAPVWLSMLLALLLCRALAAPAGSVKGKQNLGALARGLWPLAAGLVLRAGASALLRLAAGVSGADGTASKTIFWFSRASVREAVVIPLREWIDNYLAMAFGVPALALLLLAVLALLVWAVWRRGQKNGLLPLAVLLVLSQYALGILQGTGSQMARTVQCFAVFVPFAAWLLLEPLLAGPTAGGPAAKKKRRPARLAAACAAVALLVAEVCSLADTFAFDRARWQYEAGVLQGVGAELAALDPSGSLPVAFCGEIALSDALQARAVLPPANPAYRAAWVVHALLGGPQGELYRYENPNQLVINWAQTAFGGHEQLYRLMDEVGAPCAQAAPEQQAAADALAGTLPHWPQAGSVVAENGYILVNF